MTNTDFERNEWRIGEAFRSTFGAIYSVSSTPIDVRTVVVRSGLDGVSCVDAGKWMSAVNPNGTVASRATVQALHASPKGVVAMDFRDVTKNPAQRMRHIYNLFFALASQLGVAAGEIRERLIWAVVLEGNDRPGNTSSEYTDLLSSGLVSLARDTWEYDISEIPSFKSKNDERRLTGLVCHKVYLLYKNEVGAFARAKGF